MRKLQDLDKRVEWAKLKGEHGEMSPHLEELTQYVFYSGPLPYLKHLPRQLERLRKSLTEAYNNTKSIINSSSVADDLRECENDIDDFLSSYSV